MVSKRDIGVFLIGHDSTHNFFLNMDIIRNNFKDGALYNIVGVYNGDIKDIRTGTQENNFINLKNRGYQDGAFDLYKRSLEFAKIMNLDYTVIMNFDVWFMDGEKFINIIEELDSSDKFFATGRDEKLFRPLTDMFIFKTKNIPTMYQKVLQERVNDPRLKEDYSSSKYGWEIFEEWMMFSLYNEYVAKEEYHEEELLKYWHIVDRGDGPRYRWSEHNKILHTHSNTEKQEKINQLGLKGKFIDKYMQIRFEK